jgi:O-antigen ligase
MRSRFRAGELVVPILACLATLASIGMTYASLDSASMFLAIPWLAALVAMALLLSWKPLDMWLCFYPFLVAQPLISPIFAWAILLLLLALIQLSQVDQRSRLPMEQVVHLALILGWALFGFFNAGGNLVALNKLLGTYLLPVVIYVVIHLLPDDSDIEFKLPRISVLAFALIGVGSLIYKFQHPTQERVAGYFEISPTMLGQTSASLFPIALFYLATTRRKTWGVVLITLLMLTNLLTNTRIALVMVVMGMAASYQYLRRFIGPALIVSGIVAVIGIQVVFTRYLELSHKTFDVSVAARLIAWSAGLKLVAAHPWAGIGLDAFSTQYLAVTKLPLVRLLHAHNSFLMKSADLGIPGMLVFFSFLYRRLRDGFRHAGAGLPRALAWMVTIFLVATLVDSVFYWTSWTIYYWIMLACLDRFTLRAQRAAAETGGDRAALAGAPSV